MYGPKDHFAVNVAVDLVVCLFVLFVCLLACLFERVLYHPCLY